ncbi:MAG: TIGR01777 family protein [Desulforudis sp.]|nr:MAG: TIGR01777 family protein [Desulforudis sp.]
MRVIVTGATGFIGRPLVTSFLADGDEVTILTRGRPSRTPDPVRTVVWPTGAGGPEEVDAAWWESLDGADAVVHLAGEPIAARRWTPEQKECIHQSRVQGTRTLVEGLARVKQRPRILVSSSAVGYYGPRGDEEVTEDELPGGDFLSQVCVAWEQEARRAESLGVRVVLLRTGIVLERDGGALPRMLTPFRSFVGGPIGSGRQWMSWVHRDDLVGLIRFAIGNKAVRGPLNAVAPNPKTNRDFSRTLGRVMGRPAWAPVPGPLLRLVLGEMAEALLLTGQRVVPAKAMELGFRFQHPELKASLRAILDRDPGHPQ